MIKYLKQSLKLIKKNPILFSYTKKIRFDGSSLSSITNNFNQSFHLDYNNGSEYVGIKECIKYDLNSGRELQGLKNINFNYIRYGYENKKLKLFGGVAFDLNEDFKKPWEGIPKISFLIPEILIEKKKNQYFLSFFKLLNKDSDIDSIMNDYNLFLKIFKKINNKNNKLEFIKDSPNFYEYEKTFKHITKHIKNKSINKIILSRIKSFSTKNKCLVKKASKNCTNFHFDFDDNKRFLGSTPETIIDLNNMKFKTHALAGTLRKNQNKIKINDFLKNKKELNEHKFVIDDLLKKLNKFSYNLNKSDKPEILELEHLYHLNTPIEGLLKNKTHVLDLLLNLYPTPAVLGKPSKKAMTLIKNYELNDRGWYGGCIGWFDMNGNGRFDVTIRSALQIKNKLYCYAGSGLIESADLEYEWLETESKFKHLISLIN